MKPNYTYLAQITNIVDGDTVDADVDLGFHLRSKMRLRFNRVNTFEMKASDLNERNLAQEAKKFITDTLLNKKVIIVTEKADAFGRYLAEIFIENNLTFVCINDKLLELGLAKLYKR